MELRQPTQCLGIPIVRTQDCTQGCFDRGIDLPPGPPTSNAGELYVLSSSPFIFKYIPFRLFIAGKAL